MSHYLASALKSFLKNFIMDYKSKDALSILFSDSQFDQLLFYIFNMIQKKEETKMRFYEANLDEIHKGFKYYAQWNRANDRIL